jgi:predicted nucleic acid-binding protein
VTVVVDASVVVAALVDSGSVGAWAESVLAQGGTAAPHQLPVDVTNVLRRSVLSGHLAAETAALAHADLLAWPIALFPYAPFASRVWALRQNLSAYDAWYIALAEQLDAPLATLDERLARAPGSRCGFVRPPELGAPPP